LKKIVILSEKYIRYINTFNKYTIRIILFEKLSNIFRKTADILIRLINIQYVLFYLNQISNFVPKNSRYINAFNKYTMRIILFEKMSNIVWKKIRYINAFNKYTIYTNLFEKI